MQKRQVKIIEKKFYLKDNSLIKVVRINRKENRVIIFQYDEQKTYYIEYDTAHFYLEPVFKIGDVARFLQRSPATIRKYEQIGLLKKPTQFTMKNGPRLRFYTEKDLFEMLDFFANQRPPGRPTNNKNSKIDMNHLNTSLKTRFEEK